MGMDTRLLLADEAAVVDDLGAAAAVVVLVETKVRKHRLPQARSVNCNKTTHAGRESDAAYVRLLVRARRRGCEGMDRDVIRLP